MSDEQIMCECGGVMQLRQGSRGAFYGCSNFRATGCRNTKQAPEGTASDPTLKNTLSHRFGIATPAYQAPAPKPQKVIVEKIVAELECPCCKNTINFKVMLDGFKQVISETVEDDDPQDDLPF